MRTLMLRATVGVLCLFGAAAHAQSPNTDTYFYTPGGGGVNGSLGMCLNASQKAVPCSNAGVLGSPVSGASPQFPANSTPVTASANGTTAATTATLPAAAGKTTYL
jgi:hypothetical protein